MVAFYSISTIVSDLMPNPLNTNILNIYDLVGLCSLFNAKSSLNIYISNIYDLVLLGFFCILTIVGYLMPNLFLLIKQFYFTQFSLT